MTAEEEIIMRHALITTQLLHQGREAAITQAEAHEGLKHQAQAKARSQPAALGRSTRAVTLARRVRALATRTS